MSSAEDDDALHTWFSQSIVALSVSTSARTSPAVTSCPSFTFQVAIFPCDIVGERAGIWSSCRVLIAVRGVND